MSLPASFYSTGYQPQWDDRDPDDDDDRYFWGRRGEVEAAYHRLGMTPPAIGCVAELKEARAWLACVKQTA